MTEADIRQVLAASLREVAPEADLAHVAPDANLRESLDIDSFDFLNLLIGLNRRLGVAVPESDYGQLTTLSELIRYLLARC